MHRRRRVDRADDLPDRNVAWHPGADDHPRADDLPAVLGLREHLVRAVDGGAAHGVAIDGHRAWPRTRARDRRAADSRVERAAAYRRAGLRTVRHLHGVLRGAIRYGTRLATASACRASGVAVQHRHIVV